MSRITSLIPRRLHRPVVVVAVSALLAACGGGSSGDNGIVTPPPPPGGPVATTAVSMRGTAFDPSAIVVAPGAAVTFTNLDGFNHNVTFDNAAIARTGNFATGSAVLTMPTTTGIYAYRCTLHAGMTGSVQVQ